MTKGIWLAVAVLGLAMLACGENGAPESERAPSQPASGQDISQLASIFDSGHTAYGFFPSPPKPGLDTVLQHFKDLGQHADFILIQLNIPWEDFLGGVEGESKSRQDLRNQTVLAGLNGMQWVVVVDPLNGLNRREFFGLPPGWKPSFGDPQVRQAYTNFSLWVVRELKPRYLGLASEINTYMDAHPEDVENFLSLYRETYDRIKAEAPGTQVFVTFQWDDLNNMYAPAAEGRQPYDTNWDQVEAFEPRLDVWVVSSYPYFVFSSGAQIPPDYYSPLLERTDKPVAVAEGGWATRTGGPVGGTPEDQVAYLQAIHDQLGERLVFWVYIILNDLDMEAMAEAMRAAGRPQKDVETLSLFASVGLREADGTPKPALELWDRYRQGQ